MSLHIVEPSAMPESVSSGICIVWVFRVALGSAMLWCVVPNLYNAFCAQVRSFLPPPSKQSASKRSVASRQCEDKFVAQQLRSSLAEGDHHMAYKLWQRAKSLEGSISVSLSDIVHLLRALGQSHTEVVGELRAAFDCNASLGDSAAELLDDLRRRGMIGLLGKIISLLNEKGINCSSIPQKSASGSDDSYSDDDASTHVSKSECSTQSETSDDEEDMSSPAPSLQPTDCQIPLATFLGLRPRKGNPPAGYLHSVCDEERKELLKSKSLQPQTSDRWECLRTDGHASSRDECRPKADRLSPWRKIAPETTVLSKLSAGGPECAEPFVAASKPGSLSCSLVGGISLRPTRKL